MSYYDKDYSRWRREIGLPNAEVYDMREVLYTRRYYKQKRYLFGLIKVNVPVREVITRYDLKKERGEVPGSSECKRYAEL